MDAFLLGHGVHVKPRHSNVISMKTSKIDFLKTSEK